MRRRYDHIRKIHDGDVGRCSNYKTCRGCGRSYNTALAVYDLCCICQSEEKIGVGTVALDTLEVLATKIAVQTLENCEFLEDFQHLLLANVAVSLADDGGKAVKLSQWNREMNIILKSFDNMTIPTSRKIHTLKGRIMDITEKLKALEEPRNKNSFDIAVETELAVIYQEIIIQMKDMLSTLEQAVEKEEAKVALKS